MATFRQIEAFKAVMDAGTVKKAAELIHLSQPAVSRLLTDLEANLGFSLFERRKGRIVARREAHELHAEVERSFAGLERIAEAADRIGRQHMRRLRIAALPSFSMSPLPAIVTDLVEKNPELFVTLESRSRLRIVEGIADGRYDIGLASVPIQTSDVAVAPLLRSEVLCLLPRHHPLSNREVITPKDLEGVVVIAGAERTPMRLSLDRLLRDSGAQCERRVDVTSMQMACALVAQGVGVTYAAEWLVAGAALPGIRAVPFEPAVHVEFAMLLPNGRRPEGILAEFIEACREATRGQRQLWETPQPGEVDPKQSPGG